MLDNLFSRYESIVKKADYLFKKIHEQYPASVRCRIHCCECCNAIFGVFPVEAAYIHYHFNHLERKKKRDVLRRAEKAEAEMMRTEDRLKVLDDKPQVKLHGLGKQRVRCPFLTDKKECVFYDKRPIICRVYGVPFSLKDGKKEHSYVCGISGFQEKVTYPTVKLDKIYHELCQLSEELLKKTGLAYQEKASFMLTLSKVLKTPLEAIIKGDFGE